MRSACMSVCVSALKNCVKGDEEKYKVGWEVLTGELLCRLSGNENGEFKEKWGLPGKEWGKSKQTEGKACAKLRGTEEFI